jgi:surfeit locus 1 family protein
MQAPVRGARSLASTATMLAACALACAGFVTLGVWQVHRLAWKEALIARVDRNSQAATAAAPGPARWAAITPDDEYRRVTAQGRFDYGREVLVTANTELGAGYRVLTPLLTAQGSWLLVNRGFVPPELRGQVPHGPEEASVTGLLRLTEPGGRLLLHNDAAAGRWYSPDVAAIAAAQGCDGPVAPYFLDALATQGPGQWPPQWPRSGLTVLRFPNSHRAYALTWFALAALAAAATGLVLLDARRARRSPPPAAGASVTAVTTSPKREART